MVTFVSLRKRLLLARLLRYLQRCGIETVEEVYDSNPLDVPCVLVFVAIPPTVIAVGVVSLISHIDQLSSLSDLFQDVPIGLSGNSL